MFDLFDSQLVMPLDDDPESSFQILDVSHADSFSDQAGHTVAPFVIQSFDQAGLAAAFARGSVLPGRKPLGVSLIKVRIDEFATIARGQ